MNAQELAVGAQNLESQYEGITSDLSNKPDYGLVRYVLGVARLIGANISFDTAVNVASNPDLICNIIPHGFRLVPYGYNGWNEYYLMMDVPALSPKE